MAYSLCHLVYLLLSLKLFCTPYSLIFFHCIVNWFGWWSIQQLCLHMNIYLALFSWYSYWNFLFLISPCYYYFSSVHRPIDINAPLYTNLFILSHTNERTFTWKAISDYAPYIALFVFNSTKTYVKIWGRKNGN